MSVLCSPAAIPQDSRVYHHFVAAKMVHILTTRGWSKLSLEIQNSIKQVFYCLLRWYVR